MTDTLIEWWLAMWVLGFALTTWAWWRWHDVTLGDAVSFAIGSAILGPVLVLLYWYARWREAGPRRPPIILIKSRGYRPPRDRA